MTYRNFDPRKAEKAQAVSNWIKTTWRHNIGVTDLDGAFIFATYNGKARMWIRKIGFIEVKSRRPIMSRSQFDIFQKLHWCWSIQAVQPHIVKYYAGTFCIVYHADVPQDADPMCGFDIFKAPFSIEREVEGAYGSTNVLITSTQRWLGVGLAEVRAFGRLRPQQSSRVAAAGI